ncbi:MAG: nickel-dependent lactate racemase, partial [Synergistetes bacterium]|nr:nickel-dependent lactate racemase [Synergistota bacterium]
MKETFKLAFGSGFVEFEYELDDLMGILRPKEMPEPFSEEDIILRALANPVDSPPLRELVRKGERICIIFSDITRLWVRHNIFVPLIIEELKGAGIEDEDIFALCANGDHREQTEDEFRIILGDKAYEFLKGRIYNHHAREEGELVYLGETTYGTPVELNKKAFEADRVILTGGIVYHFLYGFGGGKKSIMPGISSRRSIMKNHGLALHPEPGRGLDPTVCAGVMQGNRVSEDAIEVAKFLKPDFLLNVIVGPGRKISHVVAGDYITAHEEGTKVYNEFHGVEIDELAELTIVSCGGYPEDINLYQTYKTLYNAERATKEGGVIIALSECREGIGNEDFYRTFTDYSNNEEREKALRREYTIGGHMAFHMSLIAEKFKVYLLSNLPDEEVRKTGMEPIKSLEEGIMKARAILGRHPSTYIIPEGHK